MQVNHGLDHLKETLQGKYAVELEIGAGGMATVYSARDVRHQRTVAIKVLRPEFAMAVGVERFLREIRVTANLQHPHILPLFDSGQAGDLLYYVMPLVRGESLQQRISREERLPIQEATRIAVAIAAALDHAHRQGLVHRDVKPANVLLADEQVFVTDFGIARTRDGESDERLTATGIMIGTPAYMSPEQAAGDDLGAASDVYALGAVLYEILSGQPPHTGPNFQAVLAKVFSEDPIPLRELRSEVPVGVEAAVARALEKEPSDRFESAADFAGALAESNGLPSTAAPRAALPHKLTGSERRYATVMQMTVEGIASLAEHIDSDELDRLTDRLYALGDAAVTNYGGVLNSTAGDELVAVFGVPVAHEDDASRAVRAALDFQRKLGDLNSQMAETIDRPVGVRIGVGSGLLVAGPSRRTEQAYSVAGDAVQVASRLAAHAGENEVLVSSETENLLAPFFNAEPLEPLHFRTGASEITPYRLIGESGARTRLEAAERTGLATFAGREREIGILNSCLDGALAGEGHVVSVVGGAGVGKSRLRYEFLRTIDLSAVRVIEGRCHAIVETSPYVPFVEALRSTLDLSDEPELSAAAVIAGVNAIDPNLADFIPYYLDLLSIRSEENKSTEQLRGEDFRLAMNEGLTALFSQASHQKPTLILLEDWHWADAASQEMLRQLGGIAAACPMLVVVTARQEGTPDLGQGDQLTTIRLGPLGPDSSKAVMSSVFGAESISEDLATHLHERTAGNPFFLEELCQAMLEEDLVRIVHGQAVLSGTLSSLKLPDTVQAVLRSRLDRVEPKARDVMRTASVVGREFEGRVLQEAMPGTSELQASLDLLKSLGIIQQMRVIPTPAYRFKHALTREAAYDSLVRHQRKTLHGVVGTVLEDLRPDMGDEKPEALAHHFSLAERWQEAVDYGRRAAEKASNLSQFPDASRLLENVAGWVKKLDEDESRLTTEIEVLLEWERACETTGNRSGQQSILERLDVLIQPDVHRRQLAETLVRRGDFNTLMGNPKLAEESLNTALRVWRELGDGAGERNALRSLGFLAWHKGDVESAIGAAKKALVIDRERNDLEAVAQDLNNLGTVLKGAGRTDEALSYLEEAVQLFESGQVQVATHHALVMAAAIYRDRGEIDKAMQLLQTSLEVQQRHRLIRQESYAMSGMAAIEIVQGRPKEALRIFEEMVRRAREVQFATGLAQGLHGLSETLMSLGREQEALPYVQESAEVFERLGEPSNEAVARQRLAELYEGEINDPPTALAEWRRVRELRHSVHDACGEFAAVERAAWLLRSTSANAEEVIASFREALSLAEEIGNQAKLGDLLNTLGMLLWQKGEYAESLSCYERALEIFGQQGDQVHAGVILNSIGAVLRDGGQPAEAMVRLLEALEINRGTGQKGLESHSLAALGDVNVAAGKIDEALAQYEASRSLRQEVGDRVGEGWMLLRIAQVEASSDRWDRALESVGKARTIAIECEESELKAACEALAR